MDNLLGQRFSTAWAGWTGKQKHMVFPSLMQLLQAVIGSLEENVLPLFWHFESQKGFNSCKFQAVTSDLSCPVKWNFQNWIGKKTFPTYDIGTNLYVPTEFLCKAAGLSQLPVLEKGVCSDLNWTAQWLQMVTHKSLEKILHWLQPKFVLSQNGSKWNALFYGLKAMPWLESTEQGLILDFKIFWAICLCKQ